MNWQILGYHTAGIAALGIAAAWLWVLLPSLAHNYLPKAPALYSASATSALHLRLALAIGVYWGFLATYSLHPPAGLLLAVPLLVSPTLTLIDSTSHKLPDSLTSALWVSQSALLLLAISGPLGTNGLPPETAARAVLTWTLLGVAGLAMAAFPFGLGLGDAKLIPPIGASLAALSPGLAWAWLSGAFLLAGAWAALGLVTGRYGWRQSIAFGPALLTALGLLAAALALWQT